MNTVDIYAEQDGNHLETFGNVWKPLETREGNTKLPARRVVPSKYWCFTYFFENLETLETLKESLGKYEFIYGIETCPTTGRKHAQGYVDFGSKKRPMETIKIHGIHWEKCKGNKEQNIKYCSKEGQVTTNMKIPKPLKDPIEGKELYDWQKEILKIINAPVDERKIYWYWDENGNAGKTSLCKHICMTRNAILVSGKAADIKNGVVTHLEKHKEIDIALFHFVRSEEEFISYAALESIKDGIFFSGKYESGMAIFNSPHIIVFANFEPKKEKLSKDRWIVRNLNPTRRPKGLHESKVQGYNPSTSDDDSAQEED